MQQTGRTSETAGSVVTLILGVAMIGVVVSFWFFGRTPAGTADPKAVAAAARWQATCTGPTPDSTLPDSGRAAETLRGLSPGRRGYLLVQIGACANCLVEELTAWRRAAGRYGYRMVLVTHAQTPPQDNYQDEPALRDLALAHDKDGTLTRYFNSCFTPRAFVFDRNWRLTAFQAEGDPPLKDPFGDPSLKRLR
jgi:hypothetical protein